MGSITGMTVTSLSSSWHTKPARGRGARRWKGDDVDLGLTDKVALVTGSYRGTGAGIARSLAAEGAVVLVHGLEAGQADEVAGAIRDDGGRASAVSGDIRTEAGTEAMVREVRAQVERVDIVVTNYGNT